MATGLTAEQVLQMNAAARPVEFEVLGGKDPEVRIQVDDEGRQAILRLKLTVASVNRVGNDPSTGLPVYQVNHQSVIGLVKCDPELKRKSVFRGSTDTTSGVA